MRDPQRIAPFMKRMGTAWSKMPDQRFGQLFLNYLHYLEEQHKAAFYMEDEELISGFEQYVAIFTEY